MEKQFCCAQFRAMMQIFNYFLVRNYSAIARNKMAQAKATIARNSAQRNSDWKPYSAPNTPTAIFFLGHPVYVNYNWQNGWTKSTESF